MVSLEKTVLRNPYLRRNTPSWLIGSSRPKCAPETYCEKKMLPMRPQDQKIDRQRLESLLDRGVKLGFAVEEWQRNGIWIISRSDEGYPARFKRHLKNETPPLLFGVGTHSLLAGGGVGIVGSRNVRNLAQEGEAFTRHVAEICARNQMPVVSGGARGVDQIAIETALGVGGVAIDIVAENLLNRSLVPRSTRHAITDGRLLLLSPYHPDAGFTVWNAMGRNKLIYAMADFGLVVSVERGKGGTWAGAMEELKRVKKQEPSRPVFVWTGSKSPPGNSKLLDLGAISWPEKINRDNLGQQLTDLISQFRKTPREENLPFFPTQEDREATLVEEQQAVSKLGTKAKSVYQVVLPIILSELDVPVTAEALAPKLEVEKSQLTKWLKKAVDEKKGYQTTKQTINKATVVLSDSASKGPN